MKMLGKKLGMVAAASLAGALLCMNVAAAEKELVIGVSDALTGPNALYGLASANGVEMAADEINAGGGIKVGKDSYKLRVIKSDDKSNPTEGTNSVRKLIDRDGVKFLLGFCCSVSTSAVASFIGRENVVMLIGNAADRGITAQGISNLFRAKPPADFTGSAAGVYVAKRGVKSIAVIGALKLSFFAQYVEAFEREFGKSGGKIIAKETFDLKDNDMTPQLTKLRALKPEALLVLGFPESAGFVFRQSAELGMKMPKYGQFAGTEEQFLKVVSSEQMEGVTDMRPVELTAGLNRNGAAYITNYTKKFGAAPNPTSPYGYDQLYVLKHAIERAGSVDPKKVIDAIRKGAVPREAVMMYLPIGGKMFDDNGQAYTVNAAFQWQKGKWVKVADLPSDPAVYSKFLRGLRK